MGKGVKKEYGRVGGMRTCSPIWRFGDNHQARTDDSSGKKKEIGACFGLDARVPVAISGQLEKRKSHGKANEHTDQVQQSKNWLYPDVLYFSGPFLIPSTAQTIKPVHYC